MFYFTDAFKAAFPDVESYVDNMIAVANQGAMNSEVKVNFKKFCIAQINLQEVGEPQIMLQNFRDFHGMLIRFRILILIV